MSGILHLLLNVFMVCGAIFPFLISAVLIIFRTHRPDGRIDYAERWIRGFALFAATLVVLGTEAGGLTAARPIVNMLDDHGAVGLLAKVVWGAAAGIAGIAVSWYLTSQLRYSTNLRIRLLIFVGMLAHLELIEIYAKSVSRNGFAVGPGCIPELAFIAGLLLYVVLRYDPEGVHAIQEGVQRNPPEPPPPASGLDIFGERRR